MIKKILVPVDGSARTTSALAVAHALQTATGADMTTIHVDLERHHRSVELEQDTEDFSFNGFDTGLAPVGFHIQDVIGHTDVPSGIVQEAITQEADIIVMGTHGRSGLGRILLGSVATDVLALSPIPVLLVREREEPVRTVKTLLVPIDGTPGGSQALSLALQLAHAASAKIVLLDVAVPQHVFVADTYTGVGMAGAFDPEWDQVALKAAGLYVDQMAEAVREQGVVAEGRAVLGEVASSIVTTADAVHADLIVMSTHALTGPVRALLGSVADAVARTAHHPLLLVKRRETTVREDVGAGLNGPHRVATTVAHGVPAGMS